MLFAACAARMGFCTGFIPFFIKAAIHGIGVVPCWRNIIDKVANDSQYTFRSDFS
jgi:hypothetical protein